MPTYEYRCDACGNEFSRSQRYGEEPVAECPRCGARPRRLVSRPAIVFKGSGWHVNDYRPKTTESAEGKPAESKPAESKPAESKPATDAASGKKDGDKPAKQVKKGDGPARSDPAANS